MADILEFISKEKTFTAGEIVEEKITNLLARMYDFKILIADKERSGIIESWRNDLCLIRNAVRELTKTGEET